MGEPVGGGVVTDPIDQTLHPELRIALAPELDRFPGSQAPIDGHLAHRKELVFLGMFDRGFRQLPSGEQLPISWPLAGIVTDTPAGTYFCTTHVETGREPAHAITVGVRFEDARWFRGRDTENRETSTCPDPACCREPSADLDDRWGSNVIVSARSQARILGLMAPDPYPELDMPEVLSVVDAHSRS